MIPDQKALSSRLGHCYVIGMWFLKPHMCSAIPSFPLHATLNPASKEIMRKPKSSVHWSRISFKFIGSDNLFHMIRPCLCLTHAQEESETDSDDV
jgi:hypothetical protein